MINYDKPNSLIYSYSGVIPSAAFPTLSSTPVTISPVITDSYIQLVKFTIYLSLPTGFGPPPVFEMGIINNYNIVLGKAEIVNLWFNIPNGVIWEFNPINPNALYNNSFIYEDTLLPSSLKLTADTDQPSRYIADAKYTLLYTKFTI